jgi:ABC-type Fe3+-hydroxamate transport system substrate-binding protein
MILQVGELVDKTARAKEIAGKIEHRFEDLGTERNPPLRVAYFIWNRPRMVAASHTFIDHMISQLGWKNVFGNLERYPEVSEEMIRSASPDLILLSSEPYPYKEKHLPEFRELCPRAKVWIVNGEMFSWYGSRLILAASYLRELVVRLNQV